MFDKSTYVEALNYFVNDKTNNKQLNIKRLDSCIYYYRHNMTVFKEVSRVKFLPKSNPISNNCNTYIGCGLIVIIELPKSVHCI